MKTTKFSLYLNKYFTQYLVSQRGSSPQTIDSYRYAFILFLTFMSEIKHIEAEILELSHLTYKNIIDFLNWLERKRQNSINTRNQRLIALQSFIHFLKYELPEFLPEFQKILSIQLKKGPTKEISYMKTDGVKLLVEQINTSKYEGARDYLILLILYTTGIRVSELIQIKVKDFMLNDPCTLLVNGKGNKSRYVPLINTTVDNIRKYLMLKKIDEKSMAHELVFKNHMKLPFTRQGINYIIKKYAIKARMINDAIVPKDLSPHKIRHTTAMELVTSGVDLIYIRDLLGHVSVKTTEIYAKADSMCKRKAIEAASKSIVLQEDAKWESDVGLKEWLKNFNRR